MASLTVQDKFEASTKLFSEGKFQEALDGFDECLQTPGVDAIAGVHFNRGTALFKLGRHEEALPAFVKSIELDGSIAQAHMNAGNAQLLLQKYDDAVQSFVRAYELDNSLLIAQLRLANLYNITSEHQQAVGAADIVISQDASNFAAHYERVFAIMKLQQWTEVDSDVAVLRENLDGLSDQQRTVVSAVLANAGNAKLASDDVEGALACHEAACEFKASDVNLFNAAVCCSKINRSDSAIDYMRRATQANAANGRAIQGLVQLLARRNNNESLAEISSLLERATAAGGPLHTDSDSIFTLAVTLNHSGREEEALPQLERVIELAPEHWQAHSMIGSARLHLHDYASALEHMKVAIQHSGDKADFAIHFNMGFCLLHLDQPHEAVEAFTRAHEIDPNNEAGRKAIELLTTVDINGGETAGAEKDESVNEWDGNTESAADAADSDAVEVSDAANEYPSNTPESLVTSVTSVDNQTKTVSQRKRSSLTEGVSRSVNVENASKAKELLKMMRPTYMKRGSMQNIKIGATKSLVSRYQDMINSKK